MKTTFTILFFTLAISCAAPQSRNGPSPEEGQAVAIAESEFLLSEGSNLHFSGSLNIYEAEDLTNRLEQFQKSVKESSLEGFHGNLDEKIADYLGYSYVKKANGSNGVSVWLLILGSEDLSLEFSEKEQRTEWLITKYETMEIGPDAKVYHLQGRVGDSQLREEGLLHMKLEAGSGRNMRIDI